MVVRSEAPVKSAYNEIGTGFAVLIMKKWFFEILSKMKKFIFTSILAVLIATGSTATGRDWRDEYLGLPGDNLNLYAVMKLFQESQTLEGFERNLNNPESRINNLDLNGDNFVDYIQVEDYVDGRVHNIVLRVAMNRFEYQDVALFTVEKFRGGSVHIQLIGDEALYGRNYIIEPIYDGNINKRSIRIYLRNSGYRNRLILVRTSPFEAASWPLVRYIYRPDYITWHSAWYWGYYPHYWHPWRTFYWHYYYGYHYNWYHHYYSHYRLWDHHRYTRYNDFYYTGIRAHSPLVSERINKGNYNKTYSHPEKRREGEALYVQTHPDQVSRRPDNTRVFSQERQVVELPGREAPSPAATTTETRRISTPAVETGAKAPSVGERETTRRAGTPEVLQDTKAPSVQDREATRRASPAVSVRTSSTTASDQNRVTGRRTVTSVTDRSNTGSQHTEAPPEDTSESGVQTRRVAARVNAR